LFNTQEFTRGWQILLLAFLGVATSGSVMPLYGFGTLMQPLQTAFGWTRSDMIITTSFSAFGGIFYSQLAGWLNNRFGMRPVLLASIFGLWLALLLMTQMQRMGGSVWLLYIAYMLLGFAGIGTLQVTWTELVSWWFEKNRGLALAIILCGSGFAGMVLPLMLTTAINAWDWRAGFVVMAFLPVIITLPLALLWMRPPPDDNEQKGTADAETERQKTKIKKGVSYFQGIRDWRFWIITLSLILVSGAVMVVVVNCVPILIEKGYSSADASQLFGMFGFSLIVGRILVGILVDRVWAPGVACIVFLLSGCGFYLLATLGMNTPLIMLAIALVGIGAGAEFDLAAFLVSRYFGLRDYARLFGLQLGVLSGGICLAPLLVSWSYSVTGSYVQILVVFSGFLLMAGLMMIPLGRYPEFDEYEI